MEKRKLKSIMCNVAKSVAYYSVGKSIPMNLHEPKIPKALRKERGEKN